MYERFYGFRERPFSLTPDPSYLYPSRVHREGLSHLRYGIEGHAGFTVITGEIGCGKTTLLQTVLRSIDRKTSISRLMNTMLDSRDLLEAIMLDFGLEPGQGRSKPYLIRDLAQFLVNERKAGRLALLIIDEAQNLSVSALEEVRMLSNFETEKSKLLQIVLVGQPNLRDLLARHDLEQLRQRVTVSYHLEPLTAEETHAYVNHRLRHASIGAPLTFFATGHRRHPRAQPRRRADHQRHRRCRASVRLRKRQARDRSRADERSRERPRPDERADAIRRGHASTGSGDATRAGRHGLVS